MLNKYGFKQSMAGKKAVYKNAHAESIWATIKREMLEKGVLDKLVDVRTEIFEYMEVYYNRKRRHSAPAYQSP